MASVFSIGAMSQLDALQGVNRGPRGLTRERPVPALSLCAALINAARCIPSLGPRSFTPLSRVTGGGALSQQNDIVAFWPAQAQAILVVRPCLSAVCGSRG